MGQCVKMTCHLANRYSINVSFPSLPPFLPAFMMEVTQFISMLAIDIWTI